MQGFFSRGIFGLMMACSLLTPCMGKTHVKPKPVKIDSDYVAALGLANRFLHAWETQDRENSLVLMTDAAKEHISEGQLQAFFSPGADAAYEISHGIKLKPGRYEFSVVLFETGEGANHLRMRASTILVVRTDGQEWAVDRLP